MVIIPKWKFFVVQILKFEKLFKTLVYVKVKYVTTYGKLLYSYTFFLFLTLLSLDRSIEVTMII